MTSQKPGLHPRNRHRSRYDMNALCQSCPALQDYIVQTPAGEPTVNFADPQAVKTLNKALLAHFYGVAHWDIPEGFLPLCRAALITFITLPICLPKIVTALYRSRLPSGYRHRGKPDLPADWRT